jgi:Zn-dependent metalloprotease
VCCAAVLWTATMFLAIKSEKAGAASVSLANDQILAKSVEVFNRKRAGRDGMPGELELVRIKTDELNKVHTKFRQTINGIPVWGGEAIVHLNENGSVGAITDDFKDGISVGTEAVLSAEAAVAIARQSFGTFETRAPETDLWIYRGSDRDHLAYRVQFQRIDQSDETGMPVYFIDAQTGELVFHYDNFQTAMGGSQYSGNVNFDTVLYRRMNYLEDLTRMIGTFDYQNGGAGGYPNVRFTDSDNNWFSGGNQTAAIDAQWGALQVYDYYHTNFGRLGIDGHNGPGGTASITSKRKTLVTSGVHYSVNYVNAGWTGLSMIYGDGDGVQATALTTLDIIGHEFTHGVTQYESGLIYSGESGALNEAVSDIFGSMIEARAKGLSSDTWKIGEGCWTPAIPGDAIRYMNDPHLAVDHGITADDDPDHYTERYIGPNDNGGVHTNSGIVNKQFYLLAMGGTHHLGGSMTGIGTTAASAIWYHASTDYMTSSTDFAGARAATINASNALYGVGSSQSSAVAQAWSLVGVF